jgi:ABC-type transport system involved in cytochrome c biogenesis ATPase subunit
MMKLSFRQQHLSIKELPTTELPDFTVLTGINGSGKTHLLEAIRDGKVVADGVSPAKIKLFNWNDLIPSTGEHANSQDLWNLRVTAADAASSLIKNACNSITRFFPQAKFSGEPKLADISWLLSATQSEISEVARTAQIEDPGSRQNPIVRFPDHRANIVQNATLQLSSQYGELIEHIKAFAEGKGCHFLELNESEIRHSMPPYWTPPDFLRYQFSDWFTSYHAAWERNRIDRFYAMEEGGGRLWRSDEEFIARFGRRPWEVTNEILKNAGLRYQFNHPTGPFDAPFILRLVDPVANIEIRTEDLSSGEKIILSIALLLHQSGTATGLAALPNLLLLDEIDAPLHPSFTRVLIQTLDETLVKKSGLKIILTTHSPSTVAMAPEESLYEITRDPRAIVKCSQSHAIRGLTSGFISVAPSAVVVITESGFDAEVYGKLLQAVQRHEGDRQKGLLPLTFIPASRTDDAGVGGGCAQVDNWANKLNELLSAFGGFRGLIDKDDGTREATEIVKVLNRYSIENYLLDPLTVAAILIKEGITDIFPDCPIQDSDVKKIPDLTDEARQSLIDTVCQLAETAFPDLADNRAAVEVEYLGGFKAKLPQWIFDLRGHKSSTDPHCLEEVFREVLKPICAAAKVPFLLPSTDFHRATVDMQSRILPALIPADLVAIFHELQGGEGEGTQSDVQASLH